MNKKITIQLGIILIIFIITLSTYHVFFNKLPIVEENKTISKNEVGNRIVDLKYVATDKKKNTYIIKSEFGKISDEDQNVLYLDNVKAEIKIQGSGIFLIYSDNAKYDKVSLNTFFYENVKLIHEDNLILSDKIFLNYLDKKVKITENVIYTGNKNKLSADVVDIDLITKISKIYMIEDEKNVKVKMVINGNN